MYFYRLTAVALGLYTVSSVAEAATIRVPADQGTIQAAIDSARNGDVVLVLPGVYTENVRLEGKTITLASRFLNTRESKDIEKTVIDGAGKTAVEVKKVGPETRIVGLTIRNGDDGILCSSKIQILNNRIINNTDGIDYEGGGGICRSNLFQGNRDDGVDLDGSCEVTVQDNRIRNNRDDGIEIRLHPYQGPTLNIVIRNNRISGNGEDGIQFIDYSTRSHRVFRIERNVIEGSAMAAVGCMGNKNTKENYEGADIPERIFIINNTFAANKYGITGGNNMAVLNNIFVGTKKTAMKKVDGSSISAFNLFWENGADLKDCNWQKETTLFKDPGLGPERRLTKGSPCIDRGAAQFEWKGQQLLALPERSYAGKAPDLGAFEFRTTP